MSIELKKHEIQMRLHQREKLKNTVKKNKEFRLSELQDIANKIRKARRELKQMEASK
jgi:hypothetical protein